MDENRSYWITTLKAGTGVNLPIIKIEEYQN